jgi:hypothetical protein
MIKKIFFFLNILIIYSFIVFIFFRFSSINSKSYVPNRQKQSDFTNVSSVKNDTKEQTILCFIITNEINFILLNEIYDSWVHRCDDHAFVQLISDRKDYGKRQEKIINNVFKLLQPEGLHVDSYSKLTDKVYYMFMDAYKYKKKFDWYVKTDHDTFLFVDNLRHFLKSKDSSQPVSYGYSLRTKDNNEYHSGGAGYVLSLEAFRRLGSALTTAYSFCPNTGTEDIDCSLCLERLGVKKKHAETFYPLNILDFVYGKSMGWLKKYSKYPLPNKVYYF